MRQLPPEALKELREKLAAPPKPKKRTGRPLVSLSGQKFSRWSVGLRANKPGPVFYTCLCDCGNLGIVEAGNLRRGESRQCRSCAGREVVKNLPRVRAKRTKA